MLKIFRWIYMSFLYLCKALNKPYSLLWWHKVNEKIKQQHQAKEMVKAKIRFLHCLKTKTLHQKVQVLEKERNTKTKLWDRLQTLRNCQKNTCWYRQSSPPENPPECFIKLHGKVATRVLDVHADHSGNSISNTTRSRAEESILV